MFLSKSLVSLIHLPSADAAVTRNKPKSTAMLRIRLDFVFMKQIIKKYNYCIRLKVLTDMGMTLKSCPSWFVECKCLVDTGASHFLFILSARLKNNVAAPPNKNTENFCRKRIEALEWPKPSDPKKSVRPLPKINPQISTMQSITNTHAIALQHQAIFLFISVCVF